MIDNDGHADYSKMVTVTMIEQMTALIRAYPDPFTNEIFVKTGLINAGNVNVFLMDARGRIVRSIRTFLPAGENTITILQLDDLQKGTYLLRVHVNDKATTLKLIK